MATTPISPALADPAAPSLGRRTRAVVATAFGNALEWFDFSTYAFFASVIAAHYFPKADNVAMLMSAFAAFGVGFVARPVGAIFFGRLGDGQGRKIALLISMPLMGLGTLMVGLTPAYAVVGVLAPIMLVVGRMLQGFAAGGETGNAMAFLVEWAPARRRGLYGSLSQFSSLIGTLLGSGCAALITSLMSPEDVAAWGWRIPFLIGGLLIAPLGIYLRRHVDETPVFEHQDEAAPVQARAGSPWVAGLKSIGVSMVWVTNFYTYLIYLPTFLKTYAGVSPEVALWANTIGLAATTLTIPVAGWLSDVIGRRPPMMIGALIGIVAAYPAFSFLSGTPSTLAICIIMAAFGVLNSLFAGVVPTMISEIFPTSVRTTGVSISFGLSTAIFGGFAPFILTALIGWFATPLAPIAFVVPAAAISLIVVFRLRETAHGGLEK